jgi:hypothetical protein
MTSAARVITPKDSTVNESGHAAETMTLSAGATTSKNADASETGDKAVRTGSQKAMIEAAAYHLWQQRGCPIGSDQEDWFRAETLLKELQKADDEG